MCQPPEASAEQFTHPYGKDYGPQMTFPTKLMRLQFGGSLYETESWSCSLHFTTAGDTPTAESLKTAIEIWLTAIGGPGRHTSAKLGFVKFNELDHITGKYSNPFLSEAYYYSPEFSAAGTPSLIPQGSVCVTLVTALQRGLGHAGRIFLPGYPTIAANGHMGQVQAETYADATVTLLNAIMLFQPGLTAVVWSKQGDSVTPITGAKVGSIVDTQRRRRSSIPEIYYPATVVVE